MNWRLFALASAAFAAMTAILAKVGVSGVNSNAATFYRTLVALVITGLLLWGRGEWRALDTLTPRNLVFLTLSGTATGLSWLCYFRALELGPVSRVAPIDKLSVVFVVIIAAVFLHESVTLKAALGAALVGIGVWLMAA